MLVQADEQRAEMLLKQAQQDVKSRWELYKQMAAMHYGNNDSNE
jgi:pyruvate-ferredoxin/flavodoxin oxidoreductase